MNALPTGIVTVLMTDIEGSARLWEVQPQAMAVAVVRLEKLLGQVIDCHHGFLLKQHGEGDSSLSVFVRPSHALAAASAIQRAMLAEPWPDNAPLTIRIAIHTGEAEPRDGDYFGPTPNRCARVRAIAHGGQTLITDAAAKLAANKLPAGVSLRSLGRHRLRDLERPEEIYQLEHPDLPTSFPALRSLDQVPNNLPALQSQFIGRRQEAAELTSRLDTHPLVTVVGPGGSGKTRLAVHVAAERIDDVAGGVWVVDLSESRGTDSLWAITARALDLRDQPGQALDRIVTDHLGAQPHLVVLDNCEHVLIAAAELARSIIDHCPTVKILATSREPLGLPGENIYRVPALSTPTSVLPLSASTAGAADAVALFANRAAQAWPPFALDDANASMVADICERLGGNALAIELAAARLAVLTLDQIEQRLAGPLTLLASPGRAVGESRHHSIRESLDWSWNLLTPDEQRVFSRLAVFAGGMTLDDVEAVASGPPIAPDIVVDTVASLLTKSLLSVLDDGIGARSRRFRLLEPVRAYADKRLQEADDETSIRAAHAHHFQSVAARAAPELTGPAQAEWLARLSDDHANLNAALSWFESSGDFIEGTSMAWSLWRYWYIRGHWTEGSMHLDRLLAHYLSDDTSVEHGNARHAAGTLAACRYDHRAAQYHLSIALRIRRENADLQGEANTLSNLGLAATQRSDFVGAKAYYEQSLAVRSKLDDTWGTAAVLLNLAETSQRLSDLATARAQVEQSIGAFSRLGDRWTLASALLFLGRLEYVTGHYTSARVTLNRSLAIRESLGEPTLAAECNYHLAEAEFHADNVAAARRLALDLSNDRALAHFDPMIGHVTLLLARIALVESEAEVDIVLDRAWELAERSGDALLQAGVHDIRGLRACALGDSSAARAHLLAALGQRLEIGAGLLGLIESIDHFSALAAALPLPEEASRWSKAARVARADLGAVQDEPSRRWLAALRAEFGPEDEPASAPGGTTPSIEQAIEEICAVSWP